ncbi:Ig-like domain-containing protein [Gilvimarinus sp. 1_MG-2023]|uniref:Ig-like domain-containing protein n=1 Tax=Gilvimarinus sp. 1_MG-2023 TaxID=3062638 RepID=UPI0026E2DDE9|nr:Ig-like domain-containing protein [Gilvimarinus sp. 1_MG-2023]MDO6748512.1 Ig-like domain-containing protein [Gilvimarinus sp. 1_MG-2023]
MCAVLRRCLLLFVTLSALFALAACGGGGGSTGESGGSVTNQAALTSPLSTIEVVMFETATLDISGGSGSGALAYTSNDPSIVTVGSSGELTPVSAGETQVEIEKAAQGQYRSASIMVQVVVVAAEQPALSFAEPQLTAYFDAEPFTNPVSGGAGTGELVYSSGDESIATVSADGLVTPVGSGVVTLTANKAADDHYQSASATFTLTLEKYPQQPLAFEHGFLDTVVGAEVPENTLSGGAGEGQISFSSSDSTIASVDSAGQVSVHKAGLVEISATKAADNYYQETVARYELDIGIVVDQLTALIGEDNTRITWQAQEGNVQVKRIPNASCGFQVSYYCASSNQWSVSSADSLPLTDNFTQFDMISGSYRPSFENGFLQLQNEQYRSNVLELKPLELPFEANLDIAHVEFNGKQWAFGGMYQQEPYQDGIDGYSSEIWSSVDGITWQLETANADFGEVADAKVLEFGGELYMFSGEGPSYNEQVDRTGIRVGHGVWLSSDGLNWRLIGGGNIPIYDGKVLVFDGRFWALQAEGWSDSAVSLWSSEDGVSWELEATDLPFGTRRQHMFYASDDRLYVAGGFRESNENLLSDVWTSSDGQHWELAGSDREVGKFWNNHVEYFKGAFYMFPAWGIITVGSGYPLYRSTDGISWSHIETVPFFTPRVDVLITENEMKVISSDRYQWQSEDGTNWRTPVALDQDITWRRR